MSIASPESLSGWQSATRKHVPFASNLMLFVATGLLSFDADHFLVGPHPSEWVVLVRGFALLSLAWSIALGLWCSINRLYHSHASAQVSRRRGSNGKATGDAQVGTGAIGQAAWLLFRLQLVLFGIGATTSALAFLSAET